MKKLFLTFVVVALAVACLATVVACGGNDNNKPSGKEQLVVATETGFAPFEYKNGEKLYGIDMAIMAEIAKKLDMDLVVEDMDFKAVVTSVEKGLCDVAAAALTVTPERQESINFTDAYYKASQVVLVKADNTKFDACKTKEDVENVIKAYPNGTKAAFQAGTTGEGYVGNNKNLKPQPYDKVGLAANELVNGGVEIIIVDKAPADAIVKSMNKNGAKVKAIKINLTDEDYAFGVAKGNDELLSKINAAYKELEANGTIDKIMDAYFSGGEIKPVTTVAKK